MPIVNRIEYRKAIMVYKSLNHLCPEYMTNMFKYVKQVDTRATRSSSTNDLYQRPNSMANYLSCCHVKRASLGYKKSLLSKGGILNLLYYTTYVFKSRVSPSICELWLGKLCKKLLIVNCLYNI